MKWLPEAEPGQVWRFHFSESEFYHCVLLRFKHMDSDPTHERDIWDVLDLDTERAGRVTIGYLFHGKISGVWWSRIT